MVSVELDSVHVPVLSREMEAKVRNLRMELRDKNKEYDKTEDDLKALQSVGQIIGELLRQLDGLVVGLLG